jgi:hypothetical protein
LTRRLGHPALDWILSAKIAPWRRGANDGIFHPVIRAVNLARVKSPRCHELVRRSGLRIRSARIVVKLRRRSYLKKPSAIRNF